MVRRRESPRAPGGPPRQTRAQERESRREAHAEPGPEGLYAGPVETPAGGCRELPSGGTGRDAGEIWGTADLIGVTGLGRPGTAVGTATGAVGTMKVLPHDLQRAVCPAAV